MKIPSSAFPFLIVGGIAFLVDAGIYNLLVFFPNLDGILHDQPIAAKIIAIVVASVWTYFGNRVWTFRKRNLTRSFTRYAKFVLVNAVAIGLQLGCLGVSRYILGLDGPVADNISGTFIGQALATYCRYVGYDRFVFREKQ